MALLMTIRNGPISPETGPLPDAPPRVEQVSINPTHQQYAPVAGNKTYVRSPISTTHRKDKQSKYTATTSVSPAAPPRLTHRERPWQRKHGPFYPDYTAYEVLSVFQSLQRHPDPPRRRRQLQNRARHVEEGDSWTRIERVARQQPLQSYRAVGGRRRLAAMVLTRAGMPMLFHSRRILFPLHLFRP